MKKLPYYVPFTRALVTLEDIDSQGFHIKTIEYRYGDDTLDLDSIMTTLLGKYINHQDFVRGVVTQVSSYRNDIWTLRVRCTSSKQENEYILQMREEPKI